MLPPWDEQSPLFAVGERLGPEGAPWARMAIQARKAGDSWAGEYAREAVKANRTAWSAWYEAFTA